MAQFGSSESLPPVTKNLLIANVLVFLAQFVFEQQGIALESLFALHPLQSLYPFELGDFKVWQLVTHMFMHGSFWHIAINMLVLIMFGRRLEMDWGPKRFFQFYMICGLAAGVTHLIFSYDLAIGASGAVMGVVAAFAYLYPNEQLLVYFILPVKAKWFLPAILLYDVYGIFAGHDGIAHWAHIGGALTGLSLVMFWTKRNRKTYY